MSKRIISSNKISKTYKITTNNLKSSDGNIQLSTIDSQSLCTCGKWRTDTHSTYNRTIQTNLKSDEYCTCDDAIDTRNKSLSNCNKRYTNHTLESNNLNYHQNFIEDNNNYDSINKYCTCDERALLNSETENLSKSKSKYLLKEKHKRYNNNAQLCICGKSAQERNMDINFNTINYSSSNNDVPIQTTDFSEDKQIKKRIKKISKERKEIREEVHTEIESEINWTEDLYIQVIERIQYLAAEPPDLSVQFLNDLIINRTIDNTPIKILIPVPDNYIQKQANLEVISNIKKEEDKNINENIYPENVDILNISKAYSIPIPSFNNLKIENNEMFILSKQSINNLLIEQYSLFCKGEKKNLKKQNNTLNINNSKKMWKGPIKIVKTNKLEIEDNNKDWNSLIKKESADKFEVEKKNKENYRNDNLDKKKHELEFKNSRKLFKKIDISNNNEITLLNKEKNIIKNTPTEITLNLK